MAVTKSRIMRSRSRATTGHEKYQKAIEKLNTRNKSFPKIGDLALLYVDNVDRNKTSPNNLICYVMAEKDGNFLLGCRAGVLDRWYYSNAFRLTTLNPDWTIENIPQRDPAIRYTLKNPDKNKYITINKIDYIELSLREAVTHSSLGLCQGYVRCQCVGKCSTKRCSCKASDISCNTKCHPNTTKMCVNYK
jgi:hypothetical protein